MTSFRVIPVLDILNSKAVHAVKGERDRYKPIKSQFFNTSDPIEIIDFLSKQFELKEIYIADLDGILDKSPNFRILNEILIQSNLQLILDPGIKRLHDVHEFLKYNVYKLIIGLETIENFKDIQESVRIYGADRFIVSIDMYKGRILSKIPEIQKKQSLEVVELIQQIGIKEIILLDLFRVGSLIGGIPPIYLKIREIFQGNILVGGGIKEFNDLKNYKEREFSGILIATALYNGSIKLEDIKKIQKKKN